MTTSDGVLLVLVLTAAAWAFLLLTAVVERITDAERRAMDDGCPDGCPCWGDAPR